MELTAGSNGWPHGDSSVAIVTLSEWVGQITKHLHHKLVYTGIRVDCVLTGRSVVAMLSFALVVGSGVAPVWASRA